MPLDRQKARNPVRPASSADFAEGTVRRVGDDGDAATAAGRAEAASLAGEGDVAVTPAFIAVDVQKTVGGDAAIQKGAEVAHDEKRDGAAAQLPVGEEGFKVLRDRMVQRASPCAARPVHAHAHAASIALRLLPSNATM